MENSIEIKLRTMASRVYPLRVDAQITISGLKEEVATITLIPAQQQRIIYAGRVLRSERFLSFYNIQDGHTLHVISVQPDESSAQNIPNHSAPPSVRSSTTEDNLNNDHFLPVATSVMDSTCPSQMIPDNPPDMQALFMQLRNISWSLNESEEHPAPLGGPTRQALARLLSSTSSLLSRISITSFALSGWIEEQASDPNLYEQRIQASARNLDLQLSGVGRFLDGLRSVQARALLRRPAMVEDPDTDTCNSSRPRDASCLEPNSKRRRRNNNV